MGSQPHTVKFSLSHKEREHRTKYGSLPGAQSPGVGEKPLRLTAASIPSDGGQERAPLLPIPPNRKIVKRKVLKRRAGRMPPIAQPGAQSW